MGGAAVAPPPFMGPVGGFCGDGLLRCAKAVLLCSPHAGKAPVLDDRVGRASGKRKLTGLGGPRRDRMGPEVQMSALRTDAARPECPAFPARVARGFCG